MRLAFSANNTHLLYVRLRISFNEVLQLRQIVWQFVALSPGHDLRLYRTVYNEKQQFLFYSASVANVYAAI